MPDAWRGTGQRVGGEGVLNHRGGHGRAIEPPRAACQPEQRAVHARL